MLGQYSFDTWQTVEIHASLTSSTYGLYFGPRDGSLELRATDLQFRSGQLRKGGKYLLLHNIQETVTVNGNDGTDTLNVNDQSGPAGALTYALTSNSVSRGDLLRSVMRSSTS